MNTTTKSPTTSQLQALLRPQEHILWLDYSASVSVPDQPANILQRMLRSLRLSHTPPAPALRQPTLYVLTSSRVLELREGKLHREWPLMLGMVQKVEADAHDFGNIIFDYTQGSAQTAPQACGILHVANVSAVHTQLAAAIDAAYLASPWT